MFMTKKEEEYFFSHLNTSQNVLEYGSGESTSQIANRVNSVLSVEHDLHWHEKVEKTLPKNAKVVHVATKYPHDHQKEPIHNADGNPDNFQDYVNYPLTLDKKFDLILIDGRCRAACAKVCTQIAHDDTIIFIHDFSIPPISPSRKSYLKALDYLDIVDNCGTLYKFSIKKPLAEGRKG
jgi:hypothetical protein